MHLEAALVIRRETAIGKQPINRIFLDIDSQRQPESWFLEMRLGSNVAALGGLTVSLAFGPRTMMSHLDPFSPEVPCTLVRAESLI